MRDGGNGERRRSGSFENSHRSLELRARLFRRLFHFLSYSSFSFFPTRLPVRPPHPLVALPHPLSSRRSARPPALRGLSPRFTRASANLFRRLGDGGRRNRSTLYSSRIDRQPRTDMEALYFPSSHLHVALSEALLSIKRALSWHGLSLFLSLSTAIEYPATTGRLLICDGRSRPFSLATCQIFNK